MKKIIITCFILGLVLMPTLSKATNIATTFVAGFEGYVATPYNDHGQMSIGHGLSVVWCKSHGYSVTHQSKAVALKALSQRLDEEEARLNKLTGFSSLKKRAKIALISMRYNCPGLIGPNIRKFIQTKDWYHLSMEVACGHNPHGLYGLVRRRFTEANLIRLSYGFNPMSIPRDMDAFKSYKAMYGN